MGMYNGCGVRNSVLDRARRIDRALSLGESVPKPFRKQNPVLDGKNEVVLFSRQKTMYCSTPSLALDGLVFRAQKDHPNWGFTVVELLDDNGKIKLEVYRKTVDGWEKVNFSSIREVIEHYDPMIVGYSATSRDEGPLNTLIRPEVDTNHRLLIVGGACVSAAGNQIIQNFPLRAHVYFDAGLESPAVFSRLLEDPNNWANIPGVIRIEEYEDLRCFGGDLTIRPGRSQTPEPSDKIEPVPATHQRTANWDNKTIYRVGTAVGCSYTCTFCCSGGQYIPLPIEGVSKFLDSVVVDMKRRGLGREDVLVFLEDGNVGGDLNHPDMLEHANRLLELFSTYELNIGIQVRYDNLNDEYLARLKKGNVTYIFTSIESTDPLVLKKMGKKQEGNVKEIYETFRRLRELGIDYSISFIRGTSGDTLETFMRTASLVYLLTPLHACGEITKVYPGTADARRFQRETGIDVALAYVTGRELANNQWLGPENDGTLLFMPLREAVHALDRVERLFRHGEGLVDLGLEPLSRVTYQMDEIGFFTRIPIQ